MIERRAKFRDSIIPDSSIKLLELCLTDEDNEIFMASTQRYSMNLNFRSDWALQDIISEKLKKHQPKQEILPLVLRKRKLCKNIITTEKPTLKTQKIEELFEGGKAPIMMRKFLLYQQTRTG